MSETPDYNWLERTISGSIANHQLIVTHISPLDTERFSSSLRERFSQIINTSSYKIDYVINGHTHKSSDFSPLGSLRQLDAGQTTAQRFFYALEFTGTSINEEIVHY